MDYSQILKQLYPENSIGGQCGVFCHKLVDFPLVGDTLASKTAAVKKFGFAASQVQIGDVLITSENKINGHVTFVNNIVGNNLQLTESNYHKDLRVHHTRLLAKNSPVIVGCLRGKLLFSVPAEKKTFNQQILVLCSGVPDANIPQLKIGIKNYCDKVISKTGGKFLLSVDYAITTAKFNVIIQSADGVIYVQPHDISLEGDKIQVKNKKKYDVVCLIYDDSKMLPRPNHPVEAPILEYGFNTIQIPLGWISSLNDPNVKPFTIYDNAAEIFFSHELSHACYFLANTLGAAGQRDKTHDSANPNNYPSPIFLFLDYLMELSPWWKFITK